MVFLGYMLPTDEDHYKKIIKLSENYETSVEALINYLIDKDWKETYGQS
jgi:hypothetical protein